MTRLHTSAESASPKRLQLLSTRDVAQLLRCSTRHIQRLCKAGDFPRPLRVGSLARWDSTSITSWIEQKARAERSPKPRLECGEGR